MNKQYEALENEFQMLSDFLAFETEDNYIIGRRELVGRMCVNEELCYKNFRKKYNTELQRFQHPPIGPRAFSTLGQQEKFLFKKFLEVTRRFYKKKVKKKEFDSLEEFEQFKQKQNKVIQAIDNILINLKKGTPPYKRESTVRERNAMTMRMNQRRN